MAITVGTSTATSGNQTTGFTLVINSGVVSGDILLLGVTNRGATADPTVVDNDTGGNTWAKIGNQNADTNGAITVWWKRATSGTASKTITVSGCTNSASGCVTPYTGCLGSGNPYGTPVSEANASGDESQAGITTGTDGSFVCLFVGCTSNDTLNPNTYTATSPTTLTERAEGVSSGGSDCSMSHASAEKASAGATGTISWLQTDGTGASMAFELLPSSSQTVTPTAASSQTSGATPTITYGAITKTPTAASSQSSASTPTITYGAITKTPAAAVSQGSASAPTVTMGAITVTPTAATSQGTANAPTVTQSQTVTPTPAISQGAASAPTVSYGAVTVTPTAASGTATATNPDVTLGEPPPPAAPSWAPSPGVLRTSYSGRRR